MDGTHDAEDTAKSRCIDESAAGGADDVGKCKSIENA